MIHIVFSSLFKSEEHLETICRELGLSYSKDPSFFSPLSRSSDPPDVSYFVESEGLDSIAAMAWGDLYIHNLMVSQNEDNNR